jgi:hypothetical protein
MRTRYILNEAVPSQRRILFVCEYVHEVQRINLNDIATGDTFGVSYRGQTTGTITFAADMATAIQTALEAISTIGTGNCTVTKVTGVQQYDIQLHGAIADPTSLFTAASVTGFTAGSPFTTLRGYAGGPATGLTFTAAQIQVSKNGGADANSAGTVTEIGYGRYYYQAAEAEFDTRGFLSLVTVRTDIAISFPTIEVVSGSVLRSGIAQGGASDSITLDASASSVSNFYLPCTVALRAGTGAGQGPCYGTAYNGVTKVLTVTPAFVTVPVGGTEFELLESLPMVALTDVATAVANQTVPQIIEGGTIPIKVNSGGIVSSVLEPQRSL